MKKRLVSMLLTFSIVFSVSCISLSPQATAATNSAISCASSLYTLGLFKGTGVNADGTPVYDLDRAPTRAEAVVMLVRMLGKESEAKSGGYRHPFNDVEDWATPYVGYAYTNGLSNGTSDTTYGSGETISAPQFITLVLRALGYSSGKDFQWDTSYKFSDSIGLTDGSYSAYTGFMRSDAAILLYGALSQKIKGANETLLARLYSSGTVTTEAVKSVGLYSLLNSQTTPTGEMSAEQIYAKCSSAVFYIALYDSSNAYIGQGSGFFIDSNGTAVTNYHVINEAISAKAKTTDGKVYDIEGVYSADAVGDLAIIKVKGSGFNYLEIGDSDNLKTGQTVYAIGNPKGLESTISQGILSYLNREVNGANFVQTTAAISPGSSGGALIDTYGRVIGVTTMTRRDGQNLNLAAPINKVKNMPRTNYTPFGSFEIRGSEAAYSSSSSVPDFGAYIGVPLSKSNKYYDTQYNKTYFYYYYLLSDVSAVNKNYNTDYEELLKKWGFEYYDEYETDNIAGFLFAKGKIQLLFALINSSDGKTYVYVVPILPGNAASGGSSSGGSGSGGSGSGGTYPKTEIGYSFNSSVPDFGAYFGIDISFKQTENNAYGSYYSKSSVLAISSTAVSEYINLLTKWGFSFSGPYSSAEWGLDGAFYVKGDVSVFVGTAKFSTGNEYFYINIMLNGSSGSSGSSTSSYPKTETGYYYSPLAPDFGAYFGVNIFADLSGGGTNCLLYKVSDLPLSQSDAQKEYINLLKKWGYYYQNKTDSNGAYYAKGGYYVVVGSYTYNGTGCVRILLLKISTGYSFWTSVPDFGDYFAVDSVYKSMGYNSATLYYSVSQVNASDPNALQSYYSLLESKGFKYVSDYYPNSESYGKYYSDGKSLVYAGLSVENGMKIYLITIKLSN